MANTKIEIRQEKREDFSQVYQVNKAAFRQENESRLVDLLRNSAAFIPELSLVAVLEDKVIGHILFTKIKLISGDRGETKSLALAPMAVSPAYQKQGIGGALIKKGLEIAGHLNYQSVIVVGHPEYYPGFGFVPASRWKIKAPFEVPDEAFMALELKKDSLRHASGTVQYPKEFELV